MFLLPHPTLVKRIWRERDSLVRSACPQLCNRALRESGAEDVISTINREWKSRRAGTQLSYIPGPNTNTQTCKKRAFCFLSALQRNTWRIDELWEFSCIFLLACNKVQWGKGKKARRNTIMTILQQSQGKAFQIPRWPQWPNLPISKAAPQIFLQPACHQMGCDPQLEKQRSILLLAVSVQR